MARRDETRGGTGGAGGRLAARDLRGVMLPFPTPFDARGELDAEALRTNIARWNETGVSGYVALGSTGERVHLDEAEALRVVETARESVDAAGPHTERPPALVVGVGQHSTRATILEARRAADSGADALLVITPHFYRGAMSGDALAAHFEAVADAAVVPVVVYSIPQNTGVTLAPDTVGRLSRHENIIGLKESSGDVVAFVEMLRAVGGDAEFSMLTGHGSALHAALAAGAGGAILAVACAVPRFCVALLDAFEAGDVEGARRMQQRLIPLARAVTTRFGVGGLKAALEARGYAGGTVRAPLRMPDEEARREIGRLVAEFEDYEGAPAAGPRAAASDSDGGRKGPAARPNPERGAAS